MTGAKVQCPHISSVLSLLLQFVRVHPGECLISTLLSNVKILDLDAQKCEVQSLKFHGNRCLLAISQFSPLTVLHCDEWHPKGSPHQLLPPTMKLLDPPHDSILIVQVGNSPHGTHKIRTIHIRRNQNNHFHIICHK